ncbi:hypothetical protein AB2O92_18485, partial [Acinetobacter baumannii]|uniref:hypothetical protein n=1 Tax=Acinetobacter baumannii TaxID=470 RepID=UPI003462434C
MSSQNFLGADFFVQSVTQLGATGIRVRFSHDPLSASPAGAHDGLNINLYSITGPAANVVRHAAIVPDDPQSIDLTLGAPLSLGQYTVTVSGTM